MFKQLCKVSQTWFNLRKGYSPYAFSADLISSSSLAGQPSLNDCMALKKPRSRMLVSAELGDCVYMVRFRPISSTASLNSTLSSGMCDLVPSCCNRILLLFIGHRFFWLVGAFGSSIHNKHPVLCIDSSTQAFPFLRFFDDCFAGCHFLIGQIPIFPSNHAFLFVSYLGLATAHRNMIFVRRDLC